MDDPVILSRIQFAFTVTYHYLFPQLTMGLAFLIALLKTLAITRRSELHNEAVRFWSRIFAIPCWGRAEPPSSCCGTCAADGRAKAEQLPSTARQRYLGSLHRNLAADGTLTIRVRF